MQSVSESVAAQPHARPGADAAIVMADVTVVYGVSGTEPVTAVKDISLQVNDGEFVSLVGPSGCGKSTLMRVVADLMPPTSGRASIGGASPSQMRHAGRLGLVFQQPNLMPWLTIRKNIGLLDALVAGRGGKPSQAASTVDDLLSVVGLDGFGDKLPHQLSGGMQQRAALARALALDPAVLLMDEPFGALDEITRDRMALELMRIWQRYRKTVLFVTHSLSEAVLLSDRVVLMSPRPGRIRRIFEIDLPRPRLPEIRLQPRFQELVLEINRELYQVMS